MRIAARHLQYFPFMKRVPPLVGKLVAAMLMAGCIGCESTEGHKKKPVPPDGGGDVSGLPWNRPRAFESGAGMGRMMPQSR